MQLLWHKQSSIKGSSSQTCITPFSLISKHSTPMGSESKKVERRSPWSKSRRTVPLVQVRGILIGGMSSCFEKYKGYMNHYINFEKFQRNHKPRPLSPEKRRDKSLCPSRVKHFYSWECISVQCANRTYDFTV